jgi:hypothetical protein
MTTETELKPWRYEIKHGPDGEANYAWVYDDAGNMVCTTRTHYAIAIIEAANLRRSAASAEPAVGYVSQATLTFFREGIAVGSTILAKPLGDASIPLYGSTVGADRGRRKSSLPKNWPMSFTLPSCAP